MGDMSSDHDLADLVRRVIAANVYMVLGTADAAGRPWASPVFFVPEAERHLYWISSPEVTHSRNLTQRPEVSIVVFDSQAPVGTGDESAVYMSATAAEVPTDDLERTFATFPGFAARGGGDVGLDRVRPPSPYRLYRAAVTEHFVICPRAAGVPCAPHGLSYDHRTQVDMNARPA
jgi:hypothetical protein